MNAPRQNGLWVTVEGIDGSGKDTVARSMLGEMERQGKTIFDIDAWSKKEGRLPTPEDAAGYDAVFFTEPSYVWVGAAIRDELIKSGTHYSGLAIAQAYALDRLILYSRCVLPSHERGALIIQNRNVSSSLVYQPTYDPSLTVETVAALPGNALALEHAPNRLIIASCEPKTALERIGGRSDKKDDSFFERLPFLEKLHAHYHADWFKKIWEARGTKLIYLDAAQPMDKMQNDAAHLADSLTNSKVTSSNIM